MRLSILGRPEADPRISPAGGRNVRFGEGYFVYIMTNRPRGTLYIGVTNDVFRRAAEHKAGEGSSFVRRYRLGRLVHYESFPDVKDAIAREKLLKHWYRAWKIELIEKHNPEWVDLFEEFLE